MLPSVMTDDSSPLREALTQVAATVGGAPSTTADAINDLLRRLADEHVIARVAGGADELRVVEDALFRLRFRALERLVGDRLDLAALAHLGDRLADRLERTPAPTLQRAAWSWLDLVRRAPVPRLVAAAGATSEWFTRILRVIEASSYTLGRLFAYRVETYGTRTLFREPSRGDDGRHSWLDVSARIGHIARGLHSLLDDRGVGPVAIISENRYELALVDLACLVHGIVNVMIPPDTTAADVAYIVAQSGAVAVVASTEHHLGRVSWDSLPRVHTLVSIDRASTPGRGVITLAGVERRGTTVPEQRLAQAADAVTMDGLATIMYTSGTSGRPKGITFDHRCLVSKRFARALAIPAIGEGAVFLAYLPLCHTFGRYLEMLGSVFWGATYVFAEDPSIDSLIELFRSVRPTVFISIPLKWVQLSEQILARPGADDAGDEPLRRAAREVVGDRLAVGLSAAGYLPPAVFRLFQRCGVELMSGFGMTEGTGGILMTPPGRYRDGTLGVELPGIAARLDGDGELLIRGPYVTPGYADPAHDAEARTADGWLRTGDVMERDEAGYFRIVDRKKDIFKNVKGETIAPQRVEGLFGQIDAVKRFVLIGDHRPYNTALIVPDEERVPGLAGMTPEARYELFLSHVVAANGFLAPFERVVDFALLDRDLTEARGELTRKGTLRRKEIEQSFADIVERLYQRGRLPLGATGLEIRIPAWLIQALGVTAAGLELKQGELAAARGGPVLPVELCSREPDGDSIARVGAYAYRLGGTTLDLGAILTTPALWLGNDVLVDFAPLGKHQRYRRHRPTQDVTLVGRLRPYRPGDEVRERLARALAAESPAFAELELAALLIGSEQAGDASDAVRLLERIMASQPGPLGELAVGVLRAAVARRTVEIVRCVVPALLPAERGERAATLLRRVLAEPDEVLDAATREALGERAWPEEMLDAMIEHAHGLASGPLPPDAPGGARARRVRPLVDLLVGYGAVHPARYRKIRHGLARVEAFADDGETAALARAGRAELASRLRDWIGQPMRVAVDPETGREYGWAAAVSFDDRVPRADREVLLPAIRDKLLVHESVFVLSPGVLLRLSDVPEGGIWIEPRASSPQRAVYRATVHTRFRGHYDFVIKLDRGRGVEELAGDVLTAQLTGDSAERSVAARHGGFWPELGIVSEEFLAGRTAEQHLLRSARHGTLVAEWPHIVFCAALASFEFWQASGRRLVITDLSPKNFVVPDDDLQIRPRILSASKRARFTTVARLLGAFADAFLAPVLQDHPELGAVNIDATILSALLEVVGVDEGLALLGAAAAEDPAWSRRVGALAETIGAHGFVPRQLASAIERYREWSSHLSRPTVEACAAMVQELSYAYNLRALRTRYPEARVRLFRETVFSDAPDWALRDLDAIVGELRRGELARDALTERVCAMRGHPESTPELEYFLTRLSHPHLEPGDEASFVTADGSGPWTDVAVTLEDETGRVFHVRPPVNPGEIGALHRLYLANNIEIAFQPHHSFLVAVDHRGAIIGGVFYSVDASAGTAHLEKIVVAESSRNLGVGDGLMNEMFKRAASAGARTVRTGFYRRGYFYRLGFAAEESYAGLVKHLDGSEPDGRRQPGGTMRVVRPRRAGDNQE